MGFDWATLYEARSVWGEAVRALQALDQEDLVVVLTEAMAEPSQRRYALMAMADLPPTLGLSALPALVEEALSGNSDVPLTLYVLLHLPRDVVVAELERQSDARFDFDDEWMMWRLTQLLETLGEYDRLRTLADRLLQSPDESIRSVGIDTYERIGWHSADQPGA